MNTAMEKLREKLGPLPEGKCLAGLSGGADSTALILLLAAERDAGRIQPEAVHVNHGLRDAESDRDEEFCKKLCGRLQIPFHSEHASLEGKRDENACREARFGCFRKVMKETGISILILAHNRNDLAETFLMRLIRGAGTEGLACMSVKDIRNEYVIYRPMLKMDRNEIREALKQDGVSWREDSLNLSDAYLRNRIRRKLIPMMDELCPDAAARIANTAEIITAENRFLQNAAESFLEAHAEERMIDADALRTQPEALQRRILRAWWQQNAPERKEHVLNALQTSELLSLAATERGKANLPGGLHAVRGRRGIYLTGFPKTVPDPVQFHPEISGETRFGKFRLRTGPSEGNPGDGINEQEVPEGFLRGCVIRTRKAGDRIRPFGMKGSRKLQDYLTDRGIDEPLRDEIPLICRENEVLMVAGVGSGAVPLWNVKEKNIRLKWFGQMLWNPGERMENNDESEL